MKIKRDKQLIIKDRTCTRKVNDYDSAYYYYHKALEYFIDLNSVSGMSACFNRIGNLYLNTNNYESAKVYLESAYKTYKVLLI